MAKRSAPSRSITSSFAWKLCEKFGAQFVQMVVSIVLARILAPTAYGSVAILNVFISLATVFVESGLSSALIQKVDADETDRSSVFIYSMGIAVLLYVILFICAPFIAEFYNMPQLAEMLRIFALILFPGAFNSLQVSILSKRMEFRVQAQCGLIGVVISGIVGIISALLGSGAWALVVQQLGNKIIVCISLYGHIKWLPKLRFSFGQTRSLLSYGVKLLGANLVDKLYHNLESLIIGKKFSPATLAFCDKGKMFPLTLIDNVDGAIQSVMFPGYALRQDDIKGLRSLLSRSISMSTYLVFPLMVGLACTAEPLIWLILGEDWMGAVPFMVLYCAICALFPFQTAGLQALNAVGKSGEYLRVISIKRAVGFALLLVAAVCFESPYAILAAALLGEIAGVVLSAIPLSTVLGLSLMSQIGSCVGNALMSGIMGCFVYALTFTSLSYPLMLAVQILIGVVVYATESLLTGSENFAYLRSVVAKMLGGRFHG